MRNLVIMTRFCDKKICVLCGRCCHFRREKALSADEELQIKQQVYAKTGVLYAYPFERFGLSLSTEEKKKFIEFAEKKGIEISIKPKKILHDVERGRFIVIDWFLDHDDCPFQDEKGCCSIYENRPQVCNDFPEIKNRDIIARHQSPHDVSYAVAVQMLSRAMIEHPELF